MSSLLHLEAAVSHSMALLLQWPRGDCAIQSLLRLLPFHCATATATSSPSLASGHHHGWAIVPVLNELLDHTSSQQTLLRPTLPPHEEAKATTSLSLSHRHRRRQRPVCTNCRRLFSTAHDAASRPVDGFCSVDCRASHTYMDGVCNDVDAKLKPFVSGTSPTLDSDYSCFSPVTPQLRGDCRFPTAQDAGPAIYARP